MVLVDHQIAELVAKNNLIENFDPDCLTNIGYDLRAKEFHIDKEAKTSITLYPNDSVFVSAVETIKVPTNLLARVYLKNSRIRQGLLLDAPVYQPGHSTRVFFRVTNVSGDSVTLEADESYAMIIFEELAEVPDKPYKGAFSDEFDYRGLGDYKDVYRKQIKEIEKKTEDLKSLESGIYTNLLTILSIFVALFSFLSTNIALAANSATVDQYVLFNVLLLGCISFLVALLNSIIKPKSKCWTQWIPALLSFGAAFWLFNLIRS